MQQIAKKKSVWKQLKWKLKHSKKSECHCIATATEKMLILALERGER